MKLFAPPLSILLLAASAFTLTGCSASFNTTATGSTAGAITGVAHGGRQPIKGAHIYMLEANTTAYGGPGIAAATANKSVSLLESINSGPFPTYPDGNGGYYVLTAADGSFSISNEYNNCTLGDQVYLYSVGGDAGAGVNTAAGLMAVLGTCPSGGSFPSSMTVNMNEVSTIAAAYAIAGFASDATHVGTSGSALAQTGIANAFANANQLYDISSNPYATATNTTARTTTPGTGTNGGTGTVPQQQIDTLANILSACVNTSGPASSQCNTLFTSVGNNGSAPTDTASAAIFMAQHPAANVSAIYGITGSGINPYSPWLDGSSGNSAPANFIVALSFTGGGLTETFGNEIFQQSTGLVIDGSGGAWVGSLAATGLVGVNSLGVPVSATPFPLSTGTFGLAMDSASANIWSTNILGSPTSDFNVATQTFTNPIKSYSGETSLNLAFDGDGNLWLPFVGGTSAIIKYSASGTGLYEAAGSPLQVPYALAFEPGPGGNVWVADSNTGALSFSTAAAPLTQYAPQGQFSQAVTVAVDAAGNAWFGTNSKGDVTILDKNGANASSYTLIGSTYLMIASLAIDGASHAWITTNDLNKQDGNPSDNQVFEMDASGNLLSTSAGYPPANSATSPGPIAVDGSGNVWYINSSSNSGLASPGTLTELIGAATPVATPLAYAVAHNLVGARP